MDRAVSLSALAANRPGHGLFAMLRTLASLHRQRNRLAQLDDAALHDIGLTREEAIQEARRPLWDAPKHWAK